jgi:predicted transcriptional regulator
MTERLLLWGFKAPREVAASGLGDLERQVMDTVWTLGEVSVRAVQQTIATGVAYTTLMTTLDRLYKKGLLSRRKSGRAFLYAAAVAREDLVRRVAVDVLDGLLQHRERALPLLSSLVETVTERDALLLDELERLVRQKRRSLKRGR